MFLERFITIKNLIEKEDESKEKSEKLEMVEFNIKKFNYLDSVLIDSHKNQISNLLENGKKQREEIDLIKEADINFFFDIYVIAVSSL